jgi:hypothetical protein
MDIILELGGNVNRIKAVCDLALKLPNAKIIISSELPCSEVVNLLTESGIGYDRFLLDFTAWDTVTNFTETFRLIKSYKPEKIHIVTDKFHMPRSAAIATCVYLFKKITLVPHPYLGGDLNYKEPFKLILEDAIRALVWRLTGQLIYYKQVKKERMPLFVREKQIAISSGYPASGN